MSFNISDTLTIPGIIEGMQIQEIGAHVFSGLEVKKVILKEGYTSIGKLSFWKMNTLEELHLPNSLINIQFSAFSHYVLY